jgi:hypothetical protein
MGGAPVAFNSELPPESNVAVVMLVPSLVGPGSRLGDLEG